MTQQSRRKRPFLLLAVAATLLGGAMLGILWWPAPPASNDSVLGQSTKERWPVGEVSEADYGEFRWSLPLPEAGHYVLRIYDGDGDTELLHLPPLYESHWRPNAEQRGKLRPRMTWEVEAQWSGGEVAKSLGRVAVSLRR